MPKFKEFTGAFKKEYSDEEKETYKTIYNDESEWPGADEYEEAAICINLDMVRVFNPHIDKDKITVDVGGERYTIKLSYREFAAIMKTLYTFV